MPFRGDDGAGPSPAFDTSSAATNCPRVIPRGSGVEVINYESNGRTAREAHVECAHCATSLRGGGIRTTVGQSRQRTLTPVPGQLRALPAASRTNAVELPTWLTKR
jgi:hypothetical protein